MSTERRAGVGAASGRPRNPHVSESAVAAVLADPEQSDSGCTLCVTEESFQVFLEAYRSEALEQEHLHAV